MVKGFFARRITKVQSVVHNCNYLLALLLKHSLRTSICVCKYLYMVSDTNSVFHHFLWLGPMTLTFPLPAPGPWPLQAAVIFYVLLMEMVISLRLLVIPVFCYGLQHRQRPQLYTYVCMHADILCNRNNVLYHYK